MAVAGLLAEARSSGDGRSRLSLNFLGAVEFLVKD